MPARSLANVFNGNFVLCRLQRIGTQQSRLGQPRLVLIIDDSVPARATRLHGQSEQSLVELWGSCTATVMTVDNDSVTGPNRSISRLLVRQHDVDFLNATGHERL